MPTQVIPFTSEAEWLSERLKDVTSTEIAALFDASPYLTAFELYHAKRARTIESRPDNARMRWGRRLQDPIAHGVAEDQHIEVERMSEYVRETDARIGASFDFRITGARGTGDKRGMGARLLTQGPGIMEIKTVDPVVLREQWVIVEGEVVEAPPHIELQVQQQLLVSGLQWALIVALVGGNRVSVIERDYDPELCGAIVRKAREFWQLVDQGTPPAPDYSRDAELIAKQYMQSVAGKTLDAREDAELARWCEEYQLAGDAMKTLDAQRSGARARILERIGDAARVQLADCFISAGTVRESIVPQHTRAPYRALRFTTRKEKTA